MRENKSSARIRLVKTLVKGKQPVRRRMQAVKRAIAVGRIRCRRSKDLARAWVYLKLFEKAMARLEADPSAMRAFREKRIPELKESIKAIDKRCLEQAKKAQEFTKQGKLAEARKAWRKDHELAAVRSALNAELQMFQHLLG